MTQYNLVKPCTNCPFRKDGQGVRLTPERIEEIAATCQHDGAAFICHNSFNENKSKEEHCAGALIFAMINGGPHQMARIVFRLGMWDPAKHIPHAEEVWESVEDWIEGGSL